MATEPTWLRNLAELRPEFMERKGADLYIFAACATATRAEVSDRLAWFVDEDGPLGRHDEADWRGDRPIVEDGGVVFRWQPFHADYSADRLRWERLIYFGHDAAAMESFRALATAAGSCLEIGEPSPWKPRNFALAAEWMWRVIALSRYAGCSLTCRTISMPGEVALECAGIGLGPNYHPIRVVLETDVFRASAWAIDWILEKHGTAAQTTPVTPEPPAPATIGLAGVKAKANGPAAPPKLATKPSKPTRAARLLAYMEGRQRATFSEVRRDLWRGKEVSDERLRRVASEATALLRARGDRRALATSGDEIRWEDSPA